MRLLLTLASRLQSQSPYLVLVKRMARTREQYRLSIRSLAHRETRMLSAPILALESAPGDYSVEY